LLSLTLQWSFPFLSIFPWRKNGFVFLKTEKATAHNRKNKKPLRFS